MAKQAKTYTFSTFVMKKIYLLLLTVCSSLISNSQITLVGHTLLNNSAVKQVQISVKTEGVITKTLNTQSKSDFKLELDYGKIYDIYFQNPRSPVMYMRVVANTIPVEKYEYRMGYELNIPFVYKTDEDVDTTVFKNPFFRVIFNGSKKMVDDTAYNTAFAKTVIVKPSKRNDPAVVSSGNNDSVKITPVKSVEVQAIVAGKVILNCNPQLTVKNKPISLYNKSGELVKSTYTNRFGAFSFSGIAAMDVSKIVMDIKDISADNSLYLVTSKNASVAISKPMDGYCEWKIKTTELIKLVDNHFTSNIGGKLISSKPKEKKFYAKKEVYLLNEYNTIIRKTTTNLFGTFVFEDIRPDHRYFIGIDASNIAGEKVDLLSKEDNFIGTLDSLAGGKRGLKIMSNYNTAFNDLSVGDDEMKMDVKATIYGDNVNTPIGKLKIILLNDKYEVIDSTVTDDFGTFKFKYLPFLKRFYLSAENTDNILDVFKDIIIYSNDDNLIKIMTHQKGSKFSYKPVNAELSSMRDLELEDPWLEFVDAKKPGTGQKRSLTEAPKSIVENILFETGKYSITPQSKEILDKIILVLNSNKQLKLEVGAHTDSKGNEASNLQLSRLRAKTVQDYITKSGIDIKRIISKGYGETKLLNNCKDNQPCSELEHAQNRRIEFKILGE
ncbi:hypothetical protein CNR22_22765 [Sphingobacteriaceae bacterium]|nr:hypothetical protein CNR22_22765 [Sphingobacteriaceae bacterium]